MQPILKKFSVKIFYLFLTIFLLLLIFATVYSFVYFKYPNKNLQNDTFITVDKGSSVIKVSNILAKNNVISHPRIFLYISRIINKNNLVIKSGEYLFEKNISPQEVLKKLIQGSIYYRKLTFAEGISTHSILQIINNTDGLIGELPENIKEGTLLPETYLYVKGDSKVDLINRMQRAMETVLTSLWETRDMTIPIKTKEEALILASIVEKETGVPEERGLVASVFLNRLKIGMRLQSDPTVVYSFAKGNLALEREIRRSDLRNKLPYNTYHIYGLPTSPIANPGIDSIKAVLNPPQTKYLYFVARVKGGHNFSTNLKDHINWVNQYRKELRELR
jgi:UPF0755 protein